MRRSGFAALSVAALVLVGCGRSYESQLPTGVSVTADGGVFVAGQFAGQIDLAHTVLRSAGGQDLFVACFEADGRHRWSGRWGGAGRDAVLALAALPAGDLIIAGRFAGELTLGARTHRDAGGGDAFVARLAAGNGEVRWSFRLGGAASDVAHAAAVDRHANVLVAGGSGEALVLFKLSAQGKQLWRRELRGGGRMVGLAIAVNTDGGVVVAGARGDGCVLVGFDGRGRLRWRRDFSVGDRGRLAGVSVQGRGQVSPRGLAADGEGNLVLVGWFRGAGALRLGGWPLQSAGGRDAFVGCFNADGEHRWSRRLGGSGADEADAIAIGPSGNLTVAGHFGMRLPVEARGGWLRDDVWDIDLGGGPLRSIGGSDLFLLGLGPLGRHRWSRRLGGPGLEAGAALAHFPGGGFALVGRFAGRTQLGGQKMSGAGRWDGFLLRLSAAGEPVSGRRLGD